MTFGKILKNNIMSEKITKRNLVKMLDEFLEEYGYWPDFSDFLNSKYQLTEEDIGIINTQGNRNETYISEMECYESDNNTEC